MEGDWSGHVHKAPHERNNRNERRVVLMGGEGGWHRRIRVWGGRVVRKSEKNGLMTLFMGSMDGRDII